MNTPNKNNYSLLDRKDDLKKEAEKVLSFNLSDTVKSRIFSNLSMYDRLCDFENIPVEHDIIVALEQLSEYFNIPPVITYESLILLNDFDGSPSLFSEENAADEILFYKTHFDIEYLFYEIHEIVFDFYSWNSSALVVEDLIANIWLIAKKLHHLMSHMKGSSFNALRPYWSLSWHYRKDENWKAYPGPSWAYTCWFVYMDMLLGIKDINIDSYSMDDRMLPNISWSGYITKSELDELKILIKEKGVLSDMLPEENQWIQELKRSVLKFRLWHKQAARKYIWDENLEQPWTWGAKNASAFLDDHIEETKLSISNNLLKDI